VEARERVPNLPTGILLESEVLQLRDADSFLAVLWDTHSRHADPALHSNEVADAALRLDLLLSVQKHAAFFYEDSDPRVLRHADSESGYTYPKYEH